MSTLSDLLAQARAANADRPQRTPDTLPEPGKYIATVVFANKRKTANGNDMISLKFEVTAPGAAPDKGGTSGQEGTKIWHNQTLCPENDTNVAIFFGTMAALGLGEAWWEAWGDDVDAAFDAAVSAVQGRSAQIVVDRPKDPARAGGRTVEVRFVNPGPNHAQVASPTRTVPKRPMPASPIGGAPARPAPRKPPTPPGVAL